MSTLETDTTPVRRYSNFDILIKPVKAFDTIVFIKPISEAAHEFFNDRLEIEDWQKVDTGYVVFDHRPAGHILNHVTEDLDLVVRVDRG